MPSPKTTFLFMPYCVSKTKHVDYDYNQIFLIKNEVKLSMNYIYIYIYIYTHIYDLLLVVPDACTVAVTRYIKKILFLATESKNLRV